MTWRYHVFKRWFIIGDEGEKIPGETLAETIIFRNFVTLGAEYEDHNWKHDLAQLCFMLYVGPTERA